MEKRKYQGHQPRITTASINTIQPGVRIDMPPSLTNVVKYEKLIEKRGNIVPITATYTKDGALVLAGSHDIFKAYQNNVEGEIPVIVAETADESDALLLILDMMITHTADHLTVSSCLCKLVDKYQVSRRDISRIIGKSLPWLSLAERIGRRLIPSVKEMLANGAICMRSAVEIALLPADVQKSFADRVISLALNKEQVRLWVSAYTAQECSKRTQDAMLSDPISFLKLQRKKSVPQTGYALFKSMIKRCEAVLHELVAIIETLPDSAAEEAHAQLRELLWSVTEMIDSSPDDFTQVNEVYE